jgi:hypothetical protein
MEDKFVDKVLEVLNKKYNRVNNPEVNFDLFSNVMGMGSTIISDVLINMYGIDDHSDLFYYIIKKWIRKNYGDGKMALPGDHIILIEMPDDPSPIEKGTLGFVSTINTNFYFKEDHLIVKWDDGRKLNAIVGHDKYDVIPSNDMEQFKISYSWS